MGEKAADAHMTLNYIDPMFATQCQAIAEPPLATFEEVEACRRARDEFASHVFSATNLWGAHMSENESFLMVDLNARLAIAEAGFVRLRKLEREDERARKQQTLT